MTAALAAKVVKESEDEIANVADESKVEVLCVKYLVFESLSCLVFLGKVRIR